MCSRLRSTHLLLALAALLLAGPVPAQDAIEGGERGTRTAGGPWPSGARPVPALWLVIDDGRGARLVARRQSNVVAPLAAGTSAQGIELALPTGGSGDDGDAIAAAWEGNAAAIRRITGRYGSGELVLGRLYRSDGGWQADWQLVDGLGEQESWTTRDDDAMALLSSAGSDIAARLMRRAAELLGDATSSGQVIHIEGIRSAADYARLMAYLGSLPVLRAMTPVAADGSSLRMHVDLAGDRERLDTLLASGATLRPVDGEGGVARYMLR